MDEVGKVAQLAMFVFGRCLVCVWCVFGVCLVCVSCVFGVFGMCISFAICL